MNSSTRRNDNDYDSMSPLHNSTRRTPSRQGRATRNNRSMSTSRNQKKATAMNDENMVCICFKAPPVMMNKRANKDCNCTCHMDMNNMDISGIGMMQEYPAPEMSGSNRSSRREKSSLLEELEESMYSMPNDFEETILEVEDDPSKVVPLGRFYRVNSFR